MARAMTVGSRVVGDSPDAGSNLRCHREDIAIPPPSRYGPEAQQASTRPEEHFSQARPHRTNAMIWTLLYQGRMETAAGGAPQSFQLPVQDWGLSVLRPIYGITVRARSSANAQLRVAHFQGANQESRSFAPLVPDPLPLGLVPQTPVTLAGVCPDNTLPYFFGEITVDDNASGVVEWVEVEVYAGGRPF
jgi:hypothetical protein